MPALRRQGKQNVLGEGVVVGQIRMEKVFLCVAHAQAQHNGAGAEVVTAGKGDDFGQVKNVKSEVGNGPLPPLWHSPGASGGGRGAS